MCQFAELSDIPVLMREYFIAAESIGQLQKDLDTARESQRYAESQHEAGRPVLNRSLEEKNQLKAENQRQAEELESLKTQLAQDQDENQRLQRGMFCKCTCIVVISKSTFIISSVRDMLRLVSRSPDRAARGRNRIIQREFDEGTVCRT